MTKAITLAVPRTAKVLVRVKGGRRGVLRWFPANLKAIGKNVKMRIAPKTNLSAARVASCASPGKPLTRRNKKAPAVVTADHMIPPATLRRAPAGSVSRFAREDW